MIVPSMLPEDGRMTLREHEDGSATFSFNEKASGRVCGSCTLCCKLLPVKPLNKAANQRCQHQSYGRGCKVYAHRPTACRLWSCRWLADPNTKGMTRPDRAHYVIDLEYDYVEVVNSLTGGVTKVTVLQVWNDPAFPLAYRAAELRAYMLYVAERWGVAAIVRFSESAATVVIAPPFADDGQWHERLDGMRDREHTVAERMEHFAAREAD